MSQQISLLHIDGRQQDADIVGLLLKRCPQFQFAVEHVPGLREGIALAHEREFDAVLMDPCLPDSNGPKAIQRFKEAAPELPLVVLTGAEDEELALKAIRCGAQEYLSKQHLIGHLLTRVIRHSIARQQQLHDAQNQALTDALTGIGNRRAFDMELARRVTDFDRDETGCSIVLIDIDHFKSINDRYGHDQGDEVLRGVSRTIRESLRQSDLVARYGGEEFGVILPVTPVHEAIDVAECVRQTIADNKWTLHGDSTKVTVSAGVADIRHNDDESRLLRRADELLYSAKRRGRNQCCWPSESCASK